MIRFIYLDVAASYRLLPSSIHNLHTNIIFILRLAVVVNSRAVLLFPRSFCDVIVTRYLERACSCARVRLLEVCNTCNVSSTEVHLQRHIYRSTATEVLLQRYTYRGTYTEVLLQRYFYRGTSTEVLHRIIYINTESNIRVSQFHILLKLHCMHNRYKYEIEQLV